MNRIIDISPRISGTIGVFPGDRPFCPTTTLRQDRGDPVSLSSIETTVHLGAHADAPWHYHPAGADMASVPLLAYWGPALVLHCPVEAGARVGWEALQVRLGCHAAVRGPWRCLVATGTFPDPDRWNSDFASLSPELIRGLSAAGCVLVGIDTPSVDPQESKDLPSHRALHETGMANLEGLVLAGVEEGWYELVALPLKLSGLDGSPVRAALRTLDR